MEKPLQDLSDEEIMELLNEAGFEFRKEGEILPVGDFSTPDGTLSVHIDTIDRTADVTVETRDELIAISLCEGDIERLEILLEQAKDALKNLKK